MKEIPMPVIPDGKVARLHVDEDCFITRIDEKNREDIIILKAHDTAYFWMEFGVFCRVTFNEPPIDLD